MPDRLLITGASGQLGAYLRRGLAAWRKPVVCWSGPKREAAAGATASLPSPASLASPTAGTSRPDSRRSGPPRSANRTPAHITPAAMTPVDLTRPDELAAAFRAVRPRWVVHLAAVSRVDRCFDAPDLARRVNVEATRLLVELADECGARLLVASTDMVFDGRRGGYLEDDPTGPLSEYGRTKLAAEQLVRAYERGVVVRLSLLFGPSLTGEANFFDRQCAALRQGRPLPLFVDEWRTPLALPVAAACLPEVVLSDYRGVLHLGGPETLSRWEFGCHLARALGADRELVAAERAAERSFAEPRPRDLSLDSRQIQRLFPRLPRPGCDEVLGELVGSA